MESEREISAIRKALPQVLAVSVKNVLLLGFGMTLGFPTILVPSLSGEDEDETIILDQDSISWIGSVNLLCVPLGCLLSGVITQPIGRKRAMQFVNLPFLAAWLLFYFSTEPWHVFLALCMTGFSGGLLEAPVLTYVAEITEPSIRGALSATSTMSINLGIFTSFLFGNFLSWRTMALINATLPSIVFLLLIFIPESPYWLISHNRLNEAKKSLAWLRGWAKIENIHEEYIGIVNDLQNNPMKKNYSGNFFEKHLKLYTKSSFLKPFFLTSLSFAIGHFGNTPITTYAVHIFSGLEVPISPYHVTIYIGLVQLIAVISCILLIRFLGKRQLAGIPLICASSCFLTTGIYCYLFNITDLVGGYPSRPTLSWIPLVTLICQAFFSYLGIKGLPWILVGEVYDNEVRAVGSGLTAATGYVFGFMANKSFFNFVDTLTLAGVFWFYSAVFLSGFVILYFILPETEGRTLSEITDHFAGRIKLGRSVYRTRNIMRQEKTQTLTYLAEVTTPNLRGVLASTSTVAVISGVLAQFLLGTFLNWRIVALLCSVMPVLSCILLFVVPESPYWLVSKNRLEDAQKSIAWLRGWVDVKDVAEEFNEFYKDLQNDRDANSSGDKNDEATFIRKLGRNAKLYTKTNFLWPFAVVTLTFGLGHFSGMTTLQTYAVNIFATLNAPIDKYFATIILGTVEALGCILSSILVHYVGKRRMNLFSLIGTGFSFLIVATYAQALNILTLQTGNVLLENSSDGSWVPMIFLVGAAFFSHAGIRILPWMLIGEVYHTEIRATASGFSGAASYILGFTSNKIFFAMISSLTLPGTFWFYSGISFIGCMLIYFFLPETEGKTLFQITEHFKGGEKLNNRVTNYSSERKINKNISSLDNNEGKTNDGFEVEFENNQSISIRL